MRYLFIILLLALVLITAGCETKNQEVTTPPQTTITIVPTPTPEPTVTRPLPGMDPIIGSWDNGMVFNPDGSVGSDGTVSWKANEMVNYSYFVTTETRAVKDEKSGLTINPTASSKEWIYNPNSDTIHIRDTSVAAHRVLAGTVTATPEPTGT